MQKQQQMGLGSAVASPMARGARILQCAILVGVFAGPPHCNWCGNDRCMAYKPPHMRLNNALSSIGQTAREQFKLKLLQGQRQPTWL